MVKLINQIHFILLFLKEASFCRVFFFLENTDFYHSYGLNQRNVEFCQPWLWNFQLSYCEIQGWSSERANKRFFHSGRGGRTWEDKGNERSPCEEKEIGGRDETGWNRGRKVNSGLHNRNASADERMIVHRQGRLCNGTNKARYVPWTCYVRDRHKGCTKIRKITMGFIFSSVARPFRA